MKIVTNIAIPYKVYLFYQSLAKGLPSCSTEEIIVDSLERYMTIISADIVRKVLNEKLDDNQHPFESNTEEK